MPTLLVMPVIELYTSSSPLSRMLAVILAATSPPMGSTAAHAPLPPAAVEAASSHSIHTGGSSARCTPPTHAGDMCMENTSRHCRVL